jgi:hypothetical protein
MNALVTAAILFTPLLLQDEKARTADDLDERMRGVLKLEISVIGKMALPMVLFMFESNHDANLECYADPAVVPDPAKVTVNLSGPASLENALKAGLKESKLVHFVWQGVLVITDEKSRQAFKEAAWIGFTAKDLKAHETLSRKLMTPADFEWSPDKPDETLAEFAKKSGVTIDAAALKGVELKKEGRGMLCPGSTTLWGALAFFSRTTGVRFEITKEGGLAAKPPVKSAKSR